ncbi:chloride channel CLIC-like protein 1 isoform X1 [Dendropsophus ebraccatus]|uniref:chloride channel CLIC-like protein 1 isoform X1 n=1 Tax=Dendropsophus ebraccatus TaxID=150705 RepID=UPI003831B077
MGSLGGWILSKFNFLRCRIESEPSLPPPWSLESPFQKWTLYSKASLAAAIACFIFIILHSRRRPVVPKKMMVMKRLTSLQINDSESCILDTWHYHLVLLLILCLFVSIPWEWVRLYQIEVAKKATILSEGYARSCYQQDLSFWETLKIWLSWNFSWDRDSCESYYKALMVDPLWEVTPLMQNGRGILLHVWWRHEGFGETVLTAVSSVVGRFVVHPVELFSHTIGRSLRNIMREIPSQWQLPVFLLFPLTFISVLITALSKKKNAICHQARVSTRASSTKTALVSKT